MMLAKMRNWSGLILFFFPPYITLGMLYSYMPERPCILKGKCQEIVRNYVGRRKLVQIAGQN